MPKIEIDLHYLCGLLNSRCLDTFLQLVTTPFHSGWFAYSKGYIAQIPVKIPGTVTEKRLADDIAGAVRRLTADRLKLRDGRLSDRERQSLEGEAESLERRIDEAVFKLYGVEGVPEEGPTAARPGTVGLTAKSGEQDADAARVLAEAEAQLPPDIRAELDRIEKLDKKGLLDAVTPIMRPKQAKRLASLNRKAQDEGLTDAEERERDELLRVYEKSMVVRATALAELHKRGVDVSDLIAP